VVDRIASVFFAIRSLGLPSNVMGEEGLAPDKFAKSPFTGRPSKSDSVRMKHVGDI
jgi:hypothetical protein